MACRHHRAPFQEYAQYCLSARLRHLLRLDGDGERHGARHLPAARLFRARFVRQQEADGVRLHHAEHRGESGRHAHPLRQPAEPLSLLLFLYPDGRVLRHHGDPLCRGVFYDPRHLPLCQARARRPKRRAAEDALRLALRRLRALVRALSSHRLPRLPLLLGARRRRFGASRPRPPRSCPRRLFPSPHLLRLLRVLGQPCPHPRRRGDVGRARRKGPARRRRSLLPGHLQRAFFGAPFQVYGKLPRPPHRGERGRAGHADRVAREPHHPQHLPPHDAR